MASSKSAWGIEIGSASLKAIRLVREGERVAVTDFTVIPHQQVLSAPDIDPAAMIRFTLGQFLTAHGEKLRSDRVVISVPGRDAFARFARLPVGGNLKNLPKLVEFESKQQIPYPMDEVEWDYQAFKSSDALELDVGIFAIRKTHIRELLSLYSECGLHPDVVTLAPNAVFNAATYDLSLNADSDAVLVVDVGTNATDIVVAEHGIGWIRSFPLGGHSFTEAIAGGFDLPYKKAERLKLEGAGSKHAKVVMQRMKDTFDSLIGEIRKSKEYYENTHPGSDVKTILGTGSTLKIPGLRKFITQQLGVEVQRLDEFKRIHIEGEQAAEFAANAMGLVVSYGLALQGVGLAAIDINLIPMQIRREQSWAAKGRWFAAAAGLGLLAAGLMFIRPVTARSGLGDDVPPVVTSVISQSKALRSQYDELAGAGGSAGAAQNMLALTDHRAVWPWLVHDVYASMNAAIGDQAQSITAPVKPEDDPLKGIKSVPVDRRSLVMLEDMSGAYTAPTEGGRRRIKVTMRVALSHADPTIFLNKEQSMAGWLRANADRADAPYTIVKDSIKIPDDWTTIEEGKGERQRQTPTGSSGSGSDFGSGNTNTGGTAGGEGSGASGGTGMQGRRKPPAGGTMPGMGSGLGLSGGGGEGAGDAPAGSSGSSWSDGGADGGNRSRRRTGSAAGGAEASDATKVLTEASIGRAPSLYEPGDVFYVGDVSFEVELRDAPGAVVPPPEGTP